MKLSKVITSFVFLLLGGMSINASAQSSVCSWASVYGYTSNNISYISWSCKLSSGTAVASRTDTYNQTWNTYTCGSVSVSAGYQNTGTAQGTAYPQNCNTNITTAATSSSSSSASSQASQCNTGASQIIQTSPTPYPAFNPAFCGPQPQCKYSVTPLDQYSYPRLKYTCL
ncbi:MAG TPA: hypothetical protein VIM59_10110 [Cellvibrio sp.]